MEALKKIGIIGGSGPEATALLYTYIFDFARERGGELLEHYPHLLIESVPVKQHVTEEEVPLVVNKLKKAAEVLKGGEAEVICLACNTHHLSINEISDHVGVPFISMIDLVANKAEELGVKKVAVIGTEYTLRDSLYGAALTGVGAEMLDIGEELTDRSQKIIDKALAGIKPEMVEGYVELVNEIVEKYNPDAIVLGCTEYSVLAHLMNKSSHFPNVQIIDPLKELAKAIVNASYNE